MDIFTKFKQVLKIREVLIDNNVFQLHYRVTALLLLCCAGLVASKQHFGDPIDCITRDDIPNKIMDTYCWIHATFTLPNACNKTVGIEVAHPCVDKFSHNESRVYHKYYQWVYFVLFFQAAFFYAPHFFWKTCESKLLFSLTADLRDPLFKEFEKDAKGEEAPSNRRKKASQVVTYLLRHRNNQLHERYYYFFTIFEICNFINVISQIYVVDEFLGGSFTTYGLDVINYTQMDQEYRVDPMVKIFPRMTKCTFHRFGSSGDVQTHDALCILPLNIINEKIYIVMWFWFVFLACVTGVWLIYRALTYVKPSLRYEVLERRASLVEPDSLKRVLRKATPGEWFVLYMMCKNIDAQWYRFLIDEYCRTLKIEEVKENQRKANKFIRGRRARGGSETTRHPNDHHDCLINPEEDIEDDDDDTSVGGSSKQREAFDGIAVEVPPQIKQR